MLDHLALDKDGRTLGIEPGGKEVKRHFKRVRLDGRCVGIIRRQRMQICDEEVAIVLVFVLQLDPVGEGSHVVAQMELAGGAHAAEHAGTKQ